MANYLGVNYHTIGRWEAGATPSLVYQKMLLQLQNDIKVREIVKNTPEKPQNTILQGFKRLYKAIIKVKDKRG